MKHAVWSFLRHAGTQETQQSYRFLFMMHSQQKLHSNLLPKFNLGSSAKQPRISQFRGQILSTLILVLIVVLQVFPVNSQSVDVPLNHWAYDFIERLDPEAITRKLFETYQYGQKMGVAITGYWFNSVIEVLSMRKLRNDSAVVHGIVESCTATAASSGVKRRFNKRISTRIPSPGSRPAFYPDVFVGRGRPGSQHSFYRPPVGSFYHRWQSGHQFFFDMFFWLWRIRGDVPIHKGALLGALMDCGVSVECVE